MTVDTSSRPSDDDDSPEIWLPWYLNGTLDAKRSRLVERWLAEQPDPTEPLRFEQKIADALSSRVDELPADVGLDRLLRTLDAASVTPGRRPGLARWLLSWLTLPKVATGMAVAAAVQLGAIVLLIDQPVTDTYRSAGAVSAITVRISFQPDITESQLRELLLRSNASIVGGPNQLGEYWLISRHAPIDALADTLRANSLVQSLTIDREGPDAQR